MKAIVESIKIWLSKTAVEELGDEISYSDRVASIVIIVICVLFGLSFLAHQIWSTGFFTSKFGTLEMLMLLGFLIYWIATSTLILVGLKHPSRDLDTFGGLFFATFCIIWLLVVFPFEFSNFAEVLPNFLRFLLGWISNDIARVLMVLLIIVHLIFGILSIIIRVFVYKAWALESAKTDINEDENTTSK